MRHGPAGVRSSGPRHRRIVVVTVRRNGANRVSPSSSSTSTGPRRAGARGARGADPAAGPDDRRRQRVDGRLAGGAASRFPASSCCAEPERGLRAGGNNAGVAAAADCDWVALLNPDAFPEPVARAPPRERGGAPRIQLLRQPAPRRRRPGQVDGPATPTTSAAWRGGATTAVRWPRPTSSRARSSRRAPPPLYRRDAFLEAGGFDESFFAYYEDSDLAFRLRLLGHRCSTSRPPSSTTSASRRPARRARSRSSTRSGTRLGVGQEHARPAARRLPSTAPAREPSTSAGTRCEVSRGLCSGRRRRRSTDFLRCAGATGAPAPACGLERRSARGWRRAPVRTSPASSAALPSRRRRTPRSAQSSRRTSAQ